MLVNKSKLLIDALYCCVIVILSLTFTLTLSFSVFAQTVLKNETENQAVVSVVTGEYPPFTSKNVKEHGFVSHVISQSFAHQGIKIQLTYLPWKRNLVSSRQGLFQATAFWACYEKYLKDFYCSDSLYQDSFYFYSLKNKSIKAWQTLDDLKGYRIGATRGYEYTEAFWQAANSGVLQVSIVNSDKQNLDKLFNGRVDIVVFGKMSIKDLLNKSFSQKEASLLVYHPKPFLTVSFHLLFPKVLPQSSALKERFNKGLSELKSSGKYQGYWNDLLNGVYSSDAPELIP